MEGGGAPPPLSIGLLRPFDAPGSPRLVADAISDWIKTNPGPRLVEQHLKEMEEVSRKVRVDPAKGAVVDLIRSPWASQRVIGTIASMCWRIGRAPAAFFPDER